MDRKKWEKMLTHFQAFARGYLIRNEVRRARQEFEAIVKEIDGGLSHLQWRATVISIPHFTDTHRPFSRQGSSSARKPSDPGLSVSASPESLSAGAATCLSHTKERDQHALLEKIEAETDESQTKHQDCPSKDHIPSTLVVEDGESRRQKGVREQMDDNNEGMFESIEDSSVWSSLDLDWNSGHSQKGFRQHCLLQEVPQTPEALRHHRNTLSMELVWLQQAIDSRKKYLSLKDRLNKSEQKM